MALVTHIKTYGFSMRDKGRTHVRRFASHMGTLSCEGFALDPISNNQTPGKPEHAMPFPLLGDEPLDAIVNVRLTSEEKERLRDDADMAGLSMSALIRARYFGRPVVAHADQVLIKELRRLGGLFKHAHNESGGAYSAETSAALFLVSEAIRKIAK